MRLKLLLTKQFAEIKNALRQNRDLELLDEAIEELQSGHVLAAKFKDHALNGNYTGFRECYVRPNWLLGLCHK